MARGEHAPLTPPPSIGGSIEEHLFWGIFGKFCPKFLCFNRDFKAVQKIRVLPPTVGGSTGGTFFRFRGERGGVLPPYSDRASYTPKINEELFCDPLKSIIQTTKVQQHAYHPQIQFAKINYFPDGGRTDTRFSCPTDGKSASRNNYVTTSLTGLSSCYTHTNSIWFFNQPPEPTRISRSQV